MDRKHTIAVLITIFLGCAGAAPTPSQPSGGPSEASRVAERFARAADARDVETLEEVLHPAFRVVFTVEGSAQAQVMEREAYLAGIRSGTFGGTPRRGEWTTVSLHGALAHVRGTLNGGGAHFESHFIVVKSSDGWQLIEDATVFTPPGS